MTIKIQYQLNKLLQGETLSPSDALMIYKNVPLADICKAAEIITERMAPRQFDMCSIINAKSGACPENCKWCSQSAYHSTTAEVYGFVGSEKCVEYALHNEDHGVARFSLVTSGRKPDAAMLEEICLAVRAIKAKSKIKLCASLGLMDEAALAKLFEAGVVRYHCNLETAPTFFDELCTTHAIEDKVNTLKAAKRVGMEICSGGIFGMGETMQQRIEMAFALKELEVSSIPINLLCPIPGTPLATQKPLSEDEIIVSIALFRLIHPPAYLRFAGGRDKLSSEGVKRALRTGINAAIVGDLLTTIGSTISNDKVLIREAGYTVG